MRVLDLFAGIGGFSLAAHWCGWETVGFVEWDEFNQKVLAKNFPNIPIHGDIKTYKSDRGSADIICGGFPCQPFSTAGKRKGATDDRYLWPEMLRVIREVQPTWIVGENVAGIFSMDNGAVFEEVCASLESEGYKVQPFRIPACATGAPHRRDRWWFVAYSDDVLQRRQPNGGKLQRKTKKTEGTKQWEEWEEWEEIFGQWGWARSGDGFEDTLIADAKESGRDCSPQQKMDDEKSRRKPGYRPDNNDSSFILTSTDTGSKGLQGRKLNESLEAQKQKPGSFGSIAECNKDAWGTAWFEAATLLCRVDDGLPPELDRSERKAIYNAVGYLGREEVERKTGLDLQQVEWAVQRKDRLKSLGNAIVPQVAYQIFQAIEEVNKSINHP